MNCAYAARVPYTRASVSDPPPSQPLSGPMPSVLGRYEVRAKIGEGGMAHVYVGYDRSGDGPGRAVALKIIKDEFSQNREFVDMFIDEGRIAAKLSHPNVVKLLELGNERGRLFIAMELLSGQSLWDVWGAAREQRRRVPYDIAAWMGARIADGLHHAHEHRNDAGESLRIVHRDVNPHNVFVTYDGQIKIIDFGLAKAIGRATKTAAGVVKGKLGYLAPEQASSVEIDRRADIFALATSLWEVTTNRRLFRQDEDIETLRAIYAAVVPVPNTFVSDYPDGLWVVLRRALARNRDERYPTAEAFGKDLDAFAGSGSKPVDANALSSFMSELFPKDRERQLEWLQTASGPRPLSLVPLKRPGSIAAHAPMPAAKPPVSPSRAPPTGVVIPSVHPAPAARVPVIAQGGAETSPQGGGRVLSIPPPPAPNRALVVALVLLALLLAAGVILLITQS